MENFTMQGTFTLPSKGIIYGVDKPSDITLRAMTTNEEMKRLNYSEKNYKLMADIIDDCMVEKYPVSAYDMCLADYQFLVHKLRIVTYGPIYKMQCPCQFCGSSPIINFDLTGLNVVEFTDELYKKYSTLTLPQSGKQIGLRIQTPHALDGINARAREQKRKNSEFSGDPTYLFTLETLIHTIDGEVPNPLDVGSFVRSMTMMDANYLMKYAQKLSESFGIQSVFQIECPICGLPHDATFRVTSEFFGPSIDI